MNMANVGKNIKLLRKQKNMTQDELAGRLFVSRQTVSNYENGKSNPDIEMLIKIAEILDVDVNILIFGIPVSPDKKREYRKFGIGLGILLILALLLMVVSPMAKEWESHYYDAGPSMAIQILLIPVLLLLGGWLLMQTSSVFFGAKRITGKGMRWLYHAVVVFLILYALLMVPYCLDSLRFSAIFRQWFKAEVSFSSDQIRRFIPDFWSWAVVRVYAFLNPVRFIYVLLGMVLWNGKISS